MTLASGLEIPSGKISEICRRYQIVEMSVFGSAARGDMRPDSDVDILVEFAPGVAWGWNRNWRRSWADRSIWPRRSG